MNILYGKPVAEDIRQRILSYTKTHAVTVATLGLEGDAQWAQYTASLAKSADGYCCKVVGTLLPSDVDAETFANAIKTLNEDDGVDGVLIQQPLKAYLSDTVDLLSPAKDIDGLTSQSVKALYSGKETFVPATALAVIRLLEYYGYNLACDITVVGRGMAVGRPLALMLINRNATVTVCHTRTRDVASHCKKADIVVSACGVSGLINAQHVDKHSVVIDVGLSFVNGKTCGDVDFDAVFDICAALSPVPGGVGPVTRACLFENAVKASALKLK